MSHRKDPDYHDWRAKILLEAAHELDAISKDYPSDSDERILGMVEAAANLRRMASNARRAHKKVQDKRRQESRASDAKAEAFGHD